MRIIFFISLILFACSPKLESVWHSNGQQNFSNDTLPQMSVTFSGWVVLKALPIQGKRLTGLLEYLQEQTIITRPIRKVIWLDENLKIYAEYAPEDGWSLIDYTVHDDGNLSIVTAKQDHAIRYKLLSLQEAKVVEAFELPRNEQFVAAIQTVDAAKIIALGDDVVVAARWNDSSVFTYRVSLSRNGSKVIWAHQEVFPSAYQIRSMFYTFDVICEFLNFKQRDSRFHVYLASDVEESIYTAASFYEELTLSKRTSQGDFSFYKVFSDDDMHDKNRRDLHGIKILDKSIVVFGRSKIEEVPAGWDGWLARFDKDSGDLVENKAINVKGGDIFLDLDVAKDGKYIVVGSTNYTQNPNGASVSDSRDALGVILNSEYKVSQTFRFPKESRGSEALFVRHLDESHLLISGMSNAPGSHTSDFSANGFLGIYRLD